MNIFSRKQLPAKNKCDSADTIILLLPGLGDALTASPLIRQLSQNLRATDAMTMLAPVTEYAEALGAFRHVHEIPLLSKPIESIRSILRLRGRYRNCIVPFPATRWQYALVATLLACPKTYAHDYGGLSRALFALGCSSLVSLSGGHRAAENHRLARALGLDGDPNLEYLVPENWKRERQKGLVGIHVGSMKFKGNEVRRWPIARFADLIHELAIVRRRRVRAFFGPYELSEIDALRDRFGSAIEIVSVPLAEAAASLAECDVFVGNDAGLTHLAAGLGVKTVALFGMTDPVRAAPIGHSIALRPTACAPCHDEGMSRFECVKAIEYRCMSKDLDVPIAVAAVERALCTDVPVSRPKLDSEFRLYGKRRNTGAGSGGLEHQRS